MANMRRLRYLAYGSNLHPRRLCERVPSAVVLGTLDLPGWRLAFEKLGRDGSAKCNLHPPHAAGDTAEQGSAYGVVYEIEAGERAALDAVEDLGRGYLEHRLYSPSFGDLFLYLAAPEFVDPSLSPFAWYHALVVSGARYHRLPDAYVDGIERVTTVADPDPERHAKACRLFSA